MPGSQTSAGTSSAGSTGTATCTTATGCGGCYGRGSDHRLHHMAYGLLRLLNAHEKMGLSVREQGIKIVTQGLQVIPGEAQD